MPVSGPVSSSSWMPCGLQLRRERHQLSRVARQPLELVHGQDHRLAGAARLISCASASAFSSSGRTFTLVLIFSENTRLQSARPSASSWLWSWPATRIGAGSQDPDQSSSQAVSRLVALPGRGSARCLPSSSSTSAIMTRGSVGDEAPDDGGTDTARSTGYQRHRAGQHVGHRRVSVPPPQAGVAGISPTEPTLPCRPPPGDAAWLVTWTTSGISKAGRICRARPLTACCARRWTVDTAGRPAWLGRRSPVQGAVHPGRANRVDAGGLGAQWVRWLVYTRIRRRVLVRAVPVAVLVTADRLLVSRPPWG